MGFALEPCYLSIPRLSVLHTCTVCIAHSYFCVLTHNGFQGFEGLSLGTALLRAGLKLPYLSILCIVFSFTTPVGIALGLAFGTAYNANSPAALGVEGAFNAVSAGILLYNGLVDLVVPSFDESSEETPTSGVIFGLGFVFMFLGAAAMSVLAYWA